MKHRFLYPLTLLFALLGTLLGPTLFPKFHIHWFIPSLIFALYRYPRHTSLLIAFGFGLLLDLLSPNHRIGISALAALFTTHLLSPLQRHFFEDYLSTLPLMTTFFSMLFSLFLLLFHHFLESCPFPARDALITDLLAYPMLEGCLAFTLFNLPSLLFGKRPRSGREYFAS